MKTVLVVAAHPDDEVLGCGGTIARLTAEGHAVDVAILGEGITSRYPARDQADSRLMAELQADVRRAGELLGVRRTHTYQLPDNRFDTVPLLDVVKIVEALVEQLEPQVIYTHHSGDLNVDHAVVHRAVLTATRPVEGCPVKDVLAFEVPSSTEWAFQRFEPPFRPNVFMNIAGTMDRKLEAMAAYRSEARSYPHPRSPEALRAIARRWGSAVGVQYAEAFELIRSVR